MPTPPMKYDAFISYSRADFDEVKAFIDRLAREIPGFKYWFDLEGIESGDEFVDKIVTAIGESERLLFMVSDASLRSAYAKDEVMYAHNTNKRIIPVLLKNAKLSGWFLFKFGKIDTIDTQDERQVRKLIDNLSTWINGNDNHMQEPVEEVTDLIIFRRDKKSGFADSQGNVVIPPIYDYAEPFREGLACVRKDGKYGFVNRQGSIVIPLIYGSAGTFSEGFASISINGRWGFIDRIGTPIRPFIYNYAGIFRDGLAYVKKDEKYGFVDRRGTEVIPLLYESASTFSEGFACISKNGKFGFINRQGAVVIPLEYDYAESFKEGLALVKKGKRYGYIDLSGDVVIPFKYTRATSFSKGTATVERKIWYLNEFERGKIDKKGRWLGAF